jgi:S-adenosylmethionine:tRNA ribosyltransferase-isomerase
MLISDFDYDLPPGLIAQRPLSRREASRMLIVEREAKNFRDGNFVEFPDLLDEDDVLVINNTKVFPARLSGRSETGAKVEIFLVTEIEAGLWETLVRPARRLRKGKTILFKDGMSAEVIEKRKEGKVVIRFSTTDDLDKFIDRVGSTPLPPYIKRDSSEIDSDRERYQTVFAKNRGAIAAPTAGLHFTPEVLDKIAEREIPIAEITLHVGYGTFEPVRAENLESHYVSPERYEISEENAEILAEAKAAHRRIVAVGTTTTRALESNLSNFRQFMPGEHLADLTITPAYRFMAIDALLTNFHLPRSSLLVLTSTFGGHELIMNAYRHAVAAGYRFYSYGDCMFIV